MAHQITVKDVFGEIRTRGERAWHGLGVPLPEHLTAEEGFKHLKMDWGTLLLPMFAQLPNGKKIHDPDTFLHVRNDTFEAIGTVGPKYRPIENMEMARFADALVGQDATIETETAGTLRGGRRVFCTVKLPKTIEVVRGDTLELYVVLSNSHDGSAAFNIYPTSVRVVCANTLAMSERDLAKGMRVQHSGKIDDKIEKARQVLGIVLVETKRFEDEIRTVHKLKLSKAKTKLYFEAVYDQVFGKKSEVLSNGEIVGVDGTVLGAKTVSTIQKHKETMVQRWLELAQNSRQTIKGIEGTGWAAFNAFSEWSDHERGNMKGVQESDARIGSNVFGIANLTKKRAWKQVLALA